MEYSKPSIRCGDWIIMKNVKTGFVLAVLAGFGLVWGEAVPCADDPTKLCAELDIIVRDFPVTHSDFENFQEEYYTSSHYAGRCAWATDRTSIPNGCKDIVGAPTTWISTYTTDGSWGTRRNNYDLWGCGNTQTPQYGMHIGTDGYAKFDNATIPSGLPTYLQTKVSQTGFTWYGEFEDCQYDAKLNPKGLKTMRGFVHELCVPESRTQTWTLDMIDYGDGNSKFGTSENYNGKNKGTCAGGYVCRAHSWSQAVSVTHNMVSPHLTFDPNLGEDMMYEPVISRSPSRPYACDNEHFEEWYADVDAFGNSLEAAGTNKRINTVLQLPKVDGTTNVYEIDYNRNNGGYFPLDMVDPATGNRVLYNDAYFFPTGTENQFGPQSLSIFCPPYDYAYRSSQTDYEGASTAALCEAWKRLGGPKNEYAALAASKELNTYKYLRNYGFTMMGYAKFKYKKGGNEIFEFAGDDDMWIYVDGVLAVDLGGTHLAAPGKVEMDFLSQNSHGCHAGEPLSTSTASGENCDLDADGTWKDGTWHHLHFFYADRQTDGSNMKIHSTLSELAKSRYGQPAIASVLVTMDDDGTQKITMNMNTTLDENTINMLKTKNEPAILVLRNEIVDGVAKQVVYGFYVSDVIPGQNEGASGVQYEFAGELRDASGAVVPSGIVAKDKIAFNYEYDAELFGPGKSDPNYTDDVWSQLGAWSLKMSYIITSTSGKGVAGPPNELDEWADAVLRPNPKVTTYVPDKFVEGPDFTAQSAQLTETASSNGGKLPLNATADLQFIPIPADCGSETCGSGGNPMNLKDSYKAAFTASFVSGASEVLKGVTPVTFVGGKNNGAAGLCKGNGDGSNESCFSVAYPVAGPFRLNIRVFDHLGHFVSQYQQVVTVDMLAEALGGVNTSVTVGEGVCQNPLYGPTGAAWVSAKIYPVSQNGRLLATGPYIYQVAFVQEAYTPCLLVTEKPQDAPLDYTRSNVTYRVGFRRDKKK